MPCAIFLWVIPKKSAIHNPHSAICISQSAIRNPKSEIDYYQPASFLRDLRVNTKQVFKVAFTFSPVTALAANEGTLSC